MTNMIITMLIIGTFLAAIYIVLLLISAPKYEPYVAQLEDKDHFFKAVYPVGFYVLEKIKYKYDSSLDKKRNKECCIIFGSKYAEYYLRLNYAQKVSVALIVLPIMFLIYPLMNSVLVFLMGIIGMACAVWYYDMQITDVMSKRKDDIDRELPNILSKITLLVNAGMILNEAWEQVSFTGESTLYQEMQQVNRDMHNGMSEAVALMQFGNRCSSLAVKKFISTLVQNITKGNRELVEFLRRQTDLSWEEKKHYARRQGEKASSKLMIPIGIMFIGILILVVVPVFANLSF